jgi:hypothetical protein
MRVGVEDDLGDVTARGFVAGPAWNRFDNKLHPKHFSLGI